MYPHRIRLRGPWECEPLARAAGDARPLPPPRRMTMPCRWADGGLADFRGRVRFRRRFRYPGRIDAHERVWLTIGPASGRLRIALNGTPLGQQDNGGCEFEVTSLLRERNELSIEADGGETGGLWGEIALEVRCTAYLCDVACGAKLRENGSTRVCVTGAVAGSCAQLLELYLLIDGSAAAYAALSAPVASQSFCLVSETPPPGLSANEPHGVRIDLVRAAMIWYTWEGEFSLEPHARRQS
jgi:hypothetical protein